MDFSAPIYSIMEYNPCRSSALVRQQARAMQSIQFRWIRAFRAVALTGSTNGAAEMLSIGQSAVSKHIAGLEQQLGIALFDRSKRGLRLTPEGDVLFGEADTVLEGYERFRRIADDVRHLKRGHLHIIAAGNFTRSLLPSALAEFRAEASGLSLSIEVAARRETLAGSTGNSLMLPCWHYHSTTRPTACATSAAIAASVFCRRSTLCRTRER